VKYGTIILNLVLVLTPVSGFAIPVHYNETEDGDLGDRTVSMSELGDFDIGNNTIIGSVYGSQTETADFDNFAFSITPGQQLTSLTLNFSTTGASIRGSFRRIQDDGSSDVVLWWGTDFYGPANNLDFFSLAGIDSLPTGHYAVLMSAFTSSSYPGQEIVDYQWEFQVSEVPLPAAAWLFLSGFIGLIGIARRRK
jgi:hypothetical protein